MKEFFFDRTEHKDTIFSQHIDRYVNSGFFTHTGWPLLLHVFFRGEVKKKTDEEISDAKKIK